MEQSSAFLVLFCWYSVTFSTLTHLGVSLEPLVSF